MIVLLPLLAGLVTALAVHWATRVGMPQLADGLLGLLGGCAGVALAQLLSADNVTSSLALPLVLACCLTLALTSIRAEQRN